MARILNINSYCCSKNLFSQSINCSLAQLRRVYDLVFILKPKTRLGHYGILWATCKLGDCWWTRFVSELEV